jgi:two-component system phosphate regulon response regulator PhoB
MTNSKTILIIEDEAPIRDMLRMLLQPAGFNVSEAEDGTQAEHLLHEQLPDIILLDWMLPNASGIDITQRLKKDPRYADIPIILLTARAMEENKIKGLNAGADDYIVKPFSPRELLARIQAVLRRSSTQQEHIELDGLRLETSTQRVTLQDETIKLGPTEYRLLHFFMTHPERVYDRAQLLDRVWKQQSDVDDRTVDACIRRLRKALGSTYAKRIETVHGTGYRFSNK